MYIYIKRRWTRGSTAQVLLLVHYPQRILMPRGLLNRSLASYGQRGGLQGAKTGKV